MYKAKDANIVAILRRGKNRKEWQMIRWNIENDTFQEGQWLMNKMIAPRYCSISPDGKYFFYHYWDKGQYSTDAVFSKIPNFTAEYYGEWNTYYNVCSFTNNNIGVVSLSDQFVKRNPNTELQLVLHKDTDKNEIVHVGYLGLRNHNNEFLNDNNMMESDDSIDCPVYNYKFDEYYEKHATFTDIKGRIITIKDGKLYADDNIILDTTNNCFVSVGPV
jgi:hypothetical protein